MLEIISMQSSLSSSSSFINGISPTEETISLLLLQMIIILVASHICGKVLKYFNQPTVIAEVVSGIFLGPTVMGRIPGFQETIFPKSSLSYLYLFGNFGLVLYLFLVGMELDPRKVPQHFKKAWFISLSGIALPFGLGTAVAKLVYEIYADKDEVSFASIIIFCGVAFSITAFPVLARMLVTKNLLGTSVGQMSLAAAVSNDAIAWYKIA